MDGREGEVSGESQPIAGGSRADNPVNLPSGGGAISGIGEKFSFNGFTGTGSWKVPLGLSDGRGGFTPDLDLSYDSGIGNGIFGAGWSIPLPTIARKTDKGVPMYPDPGSDVDDVFVLSGAEDLVPVPPPEELGDWVAGHLGDGWSIRFYRPRVEGMFARIERWTRIETGESHWRTISKENLTTVFGSRPDSRIADDSGDRTFKWLIERSYDEKGNVAVYDYKAEQGRSRANLHLKRLRYGNRQPVFARENWRGDDRFLFQVVFDYGEHGRSRLEEDSPWDERQDPFSTYRPGFELRTARLCRRVLMFHHFETAEPVLVRATEFEYDENPYLAKLRRVTRRGYSEDGSSLALPPLDLTYSALPSFSEAELQEGEFPGFPTSSNVSKYAEWVDLETDGAPGLLVEPGTGPAVFHRNRGLGRLGAGVAVEARETGRATAAHLRDLTGDGSLDLVEFTPGTSSYRERDGVRWSPAQPLSSVPNVDLDDPSTRFLDLDGDGLSDIVISEEEAFVWFRSLGKDGFESGRRVPRQDLESGMGGSPQLLFDDRTGATYLADLSGDGLTDLVRIRSGEVSYWPNMGHGRFGTRVSMTSAPVFPEPEEFSRDRLRLADIDGTGIADLIYLGADGITCWRNKAGNSWSEPEKIPFPPVDDPAAVQIIDLLGNGTSCVVSQSPSSAAAGGRLRYLPLAVPADGSDRRQKPHLLVEVSNNLGGVTRISYTSSAEFAMRDRDEGRPWITKLGFPVHVVDRVEREDLVTGHTRVTRYRYRHGHYDGAEREFRGFAYVEQRDADDYRIPENESGNEAALLRIPPVVTKTWFHTGACPKSGGQLEEQLAQEYFRADPDAILLPDTVFDHSISPEELRESVRALKGSILRQEVYAEDHLPDDDGSLLEPSSRPFSVSERSHRVRRLVPRGQNSYTVFHVHPEQQLDYQYERQLDDPRITHLFTLQTDDWGNVLQSAEVAYGRRESGTTRDKDVLTETEIEIQSRSSVTFVRRAFTNAVESEKEGHPSGHHAPLLADERKWELTGVPATGNRAFYLPADLADADHESVEVPHGADRTTYLKGNRPHRRIIEHMRQSYTTGPGRANGEQSDLPHGELFLPPLKGSSEKLVFDRIPARLRRRSGDASTRHLEDAGYRLQDDGSVWTPDNSQRFHGREGFYLPFKDIDGFGNVTITSYDQFALLTEEITDPVGNANRYENDYRVLKPRRQTDPNGGVSEVAFDALGLVIAGAVRGRVGDGVGESGDHLADIVGTDPRDALLRISEDPADHGRRFLGEASFRVFYDLNAWQRSVEDGSHAIEPSWSCIVRRQRHVRQEQQAGEGEIEIEIAYTSGLGDEGQQIQLNDAADPGRRWLASGVRLLDNKGELVRDYEPFFTSSARFQWRRHGVSATTFRDPLERVVGILHPDHSWEKVAFDAWSQTAWDRNDTAMIGDPRDDPDLGGFFARLDVADFLPSWSGSILNDPDARDAERAMIEKVAAHAGTPARTYLDPLGNPFLRVEDNRVCPPGAPSPDESNPMRPDHPDVFHTRHDYDIEGNQRAVIDTLGRAVMRWEYNLLGSPWRTEQMDWRSSDDPSSPGERLDILALDGQACHAWTERGHHLSYLYDGLRRKTGRVVSGEIEETLEYGESAPDAESNHLRGQLLRETVRNSSGGGQVVTLYPRYDWNGNPLAQLRETEGPPLEVNLEHDAEGQLMRASYPGDLVEERRYNAAGQLRSVQVGERVVVSDILYNARGQREKVILGRNGEGPRLRETRDYDPLTFRLSQIRTQGGRMRNRERPRWMDLRFAYDPFGNVTHIRDVADSSTAFASAPAADPHQDFTYDPVYRLVVADGREHPDQVLPVTSPVVANVDWNLSGGAAGDATRLRRYRQSYRYDAVGNMEELDHFADGTSWKRRFRYETVNNHLAECWVGPDNAQRAEKFGYDRHGNLNRCSHLSDLDWDHADRLVSATRRGNVDARFAYDASGDRAFKSEHGRERSYLGPIEAVARGGSVSYSLAIELEEERIALIEGASSEDAGLHLQLNDHQGSVRVEVEEQRDGFLRPTSYEEHHPFGTTAYGRTRRRKRYRFTGKERDSVTGFGNHGARLYASWLARWTGADPSGTADGPNRYAYVRGSPSTKIDDDGEAASDASEKPAKTSFWQKAKAFGKGALKGAAVAAVAVVVVTAAVAFAAPVVVAGAAAAGISAATVTTVGAVAGVAVAGAGAYQAYGEIKEVTTGVSSDDPSQTLSTEQRFEKAGELIGGVLGGGLIAKYGAKSIAKIARSRGNSGARRIQKVDQKKRDLQLIKDYVDLTEHRRAHILNRHRAGSGKRGKTEFPEEFTDERILHHVSDIATDPSAIRGVGKYNSPYAIGTRDGVKIRVDFYPPTHPRYAHKISTAYPIDAIPNK